MNGFCAHVLLSGLAIAMATSANAATVRKDLLPLAPVQVSATAKRFDLLTIDTKRHRLLAAHSGAGTMTIVDLAKRSILAEVPVGPCSGVSVDSADHEYFVGTRHGVTIVDSDSLKKTGFIPTPGPTDAMAFDRQSGKLYVAHDDSDEIWIVNTRTRGISGRIPIPGAPELMAIDRTSKRLYLNIKTANEVAAINLTNNKIISRWSTLPTKSPHGLAVDPINQRLLIAGHSRSIVELSVTTGKRTSVVDIGPGHVDQIAFDSKKGILYCPDAGRLIAISLRKNTVIGSVAIPKGTHSVAVDPVTHLVWIAYANKSHSYVQPIAPPRKRGE